MDEAVHVAAPEPCAKTERRDRLEKARRLAPAPGKKSGWKSAGGVKVRVEIRREKVRVEIPCKSAGGNAGGKPTIFTTLRQIYLSNKVRWTYTAAALLLFRQDSTCQTL